MDSLGFARDPAEPEGEVRGLVHGSPDHQVSTKLRDELDIADPLATQVDGLEADLGAIREGPRHEGQQGLASIESEGLPEGGITEHGSVEGRA